jgi:alkyl sulfatase BDS1-like metallo-beta-lactamase superfamily hydrolase
MQWVHSLDRMRDLRPQALIPSHTLPLIGEDKVAGVLTAYRDAIQYLHDQTVRGINRGLTPDELVEAVRLPPHLAGHPWLAEHYGTARWSVRAIHNGYLGWFNGDGADLDPLPATVRSRRLAEAFAAGRPLPEQARAAQQAGDHQWAAELARHWLRTEPDSDEARQLLARAFTDLAGNNANPNARHWYLTQARELRGDLQIGRPDPSELPDAMLDDLPIGAFLAGMATRLRAEETLDSDQLVRFEFTDVDRVFSAHLRRGVLAVREIATPDPEITIRTTTRTWKRIVTRKRNPALALAADEVSVDGGLIAVSRFLALFER